MILLSERNQVRGVAKAWKGQYPPRQWPAQQAIYKKLKKLDVETATAQDVYEIIGNSSWVRKVHCSECDTLSWECVLLGEPLYYESATAAICIDCLRKAVLLVEENR